MGGVGKCNKEGKMPREFVLSKKEKKRHAGVGQPKKKKGLPREREKMVNCKRTSHHSRREGEWRGARCPGKSPTKAGLPLHTAATVTMRGGYFGMRWQEFSFANDARGSVVEHELGPCAPRTRLLMFTLRAFPLWQPPTHIFLRGYASPTLK